MEIQVLRDTPHVLYLLLGLAVSRLHGDLYQATALSVLGLNGSNGSNGGNGSSGRQQIGDLCPGERAVGK